MISRPIGQSGIEASAIALGTWAIGGWLWGGTDEAQSIAAIRASLDAGITLIDTAPAYGMGYAEELVGKAIANRRDEVILATKCALVWHTDRGTYHIEQNGHRLHRYAGADSIRYEVEQSLKRLQVDTIDILQTHWQDNTTPIEETMTALLQLKAEGKIRAIGASNVTLPHIQAYSAVGPLDAIQNKYSMMDRGIEAEILPYCRENNIAVLAYSPLAMGLLTGKITQGRAFQGDDVRQKRPRFAPENLQAVQPFLAGLQEIAAAQGCTMSQLVIAWTLAQPGLTHVLVGARNPQQALENAQAGSIRLRQDEREQIDTLLRHYQDVFVA